MLKSILMTAAALAVLAGAARAAEVKTMRLVVDAPTLPGATRFVIEAEVDSDDNWAHSDVKGWFSALPPKTGSGALEGHCEGERCVLSVDLDPGKVKLSGDLMAASGAGKGVLEASDEQEQQSPVKGAATFGPIPNAIPGLGEQVKPDALDSLAFADLLLWAAGTTSIGDDDSHAIDDNQFESLEAWQRQNNRPVIGVLFTGDLDLLTRQRADAQKAVGWVALGGPGRGWSAGYPSKLLPEVSRVGAEQHFTSADGKATLVIAIDPPLSDEDFSAFSDKQTQDRPDRSENNYNRSGPDLNISYVEKDRAVSAVYFNRKGGLARLIYTYPKGGNPYADANSEVTLSLRATDDIKPAP